MVEVPTAGSRLAAVSSAETTGTAAEGSAGPGSACNGHFHSENLKLLFKRLHSYINKHFGMILIKKIKNENGQRSLPF